MDAFQENWGALQRRLREDRRRKREDRVRTLVTVVSEPDPDEPADSFYLHVRANARWRELMSQYQREFDCWGVEVAPSNVLPQYGAQIRVDEEAIRAVTGWSWDELYDGRPGQIADMLTDFVHALSGFYPQVQGAGGRAL